ncbi:uncharacterized protein LOC124366661 [Homalodisca vitripennis]|uniref:uncharacterized protein LOC124366661 n=1 Tax=Homalodisca vitripennis TaxID=197043 RepID=UPI001EEA486E|nr:uncharacterized protein LOC124366661 [Homalodisca vitripennis]
MESSNNSSDITRVASRRKRFIIFPRGSSLQLVYCFLTTAYGTPGGLFTIGITLGLAWEIPQDPRPYIANVSASYIQRRHRRDLYPNVETFLDKYGVEGRACILRAICEARQHSRGNGSFIEEIFNTIFSFPFLEHAIEDSSSVYDEAHQGDSCSEYKAACPTSILDLDFTGTTDAMKSSRDIT